MSIREIRRKAARKVAHSNLPGAATLSNLVRAPEDNKDLDEGIKVVVDGMIRRRAVARPMMDNFPAIGKWCNAETLAQVEMFGRPCNILIMEQVLAQMTDFGTPEQVAVYFEKYVKDIYTLRATMGSVMSLLRRYIEWGYIIEHKDGPPTDNIHPEDEPVLRNRVLNYLAEHLARADTTLEEDLVAVDLKKIFE